MHLQDNPPTMLAYKDKKIEVTEEGLVCPISLVTAFTGRDRNSAAKAVREFQQSRTWLERTYHKIEFTKINKKKMVNLKQALSMVEYFPGRIDNEDRYKMLRVIRAYIKSNPSLSIPDLRWNPGWAKAKQEQRQLALDKKTICPIHKKTANTCKGCLQLHRENPTQNPCPTAICPKHFGFLYRCKGCNRKSHYPICKLHGKRKSICSDCIDLFRLDNVNYKCPSDICRDCYKRRTLCRCLNGLVTTPFCMDE